MRILLTELETLPKNVVPVLDSLGFKVDTYQEGNLSIAHYDVVFGGSIIKQIGLESFKNLKWIQLSSAGYNHLPIEAWKQKGILVTNAKDVFSDPIAEYVLFYTLMFYKKGLEHLQLQEDKIFKRLTNRELENEVVCICGTGSLGQAIAKRFKPFNVKLIGINQTGHLVEGFDECKAISDIKTALSLSDIVVMTFPLNEKTEYFYDRSHFDAMKKGSIFINVGRGKVIDEKALVQTLNDSHLSFAVCDVMENEPLTSDSVLWRTNNLLITSHDSGVSDKTSQRLILLLIENMNRYQSNQPLRHLV